MANNEIDRIAAKPVAQSDILSCFVQECLAPGAKFDLMSAWRDELVHNAKATRQQFGNFNASNIGNRVDLAMDSAYNHEPAALAKQRV